MSDDGIRKALERLYEVMTSKENGIAWTKRVEDAITMASVALNKELPKSVPDVLTDLAIHSILERMDAEETASCHFSVHDDDEEVAIILATTNVKLMQALAAVVAGSQSDDENPVYDIN